LEKKERKQNTLMEWGAGTQVNLILKLKNLNERSS